MDNPNQGYLEGMCCPNCASFGPFLITAYTAVRVSDEGADETPDLEWDEDAAVTCPQCWHSATAAEFSGRTKPVHKRYVTQDDNIIVDHPGGDLFAVCGGAPPELPMTLALVQAENGALARTAYIDQRSSQSGLPAERFDIRFSLHIGTPIP